MDQQVWQTCWSALVLAGWDSLRVSWFIHTWYCQTRPRGWEWQSKVWKDLAHAVRWSSMRAEGERPVVNGIRKNVVTSLLNLAHKSPLDGFAFSRSARALPLPRQEKVQEALAAAAEMAKTDYPTSDGTKRSVADFVRTEASKMYQTRGRPHIPKYLPRSTASCLEWPASRGGVDGYLRHLGVQGEIERRDWRLLRYTSDPLGKFCLERAKVVLYPNQGVADMDEAYRCAGFLLLREDDTSIIPRSRAEGLRAPGGKVRVIGIPDARTFIEGSWVRTSHDLLAPGHWFVETGTQAVPRQLCPRSGTNFHSVDLSKATDGISHDVVEIIIRELCASRLIRKCELDMALRSLGVVTRMRWTFGKDTFFSVRGSPMGTPLSFIVLSWASAWASQAFSSSRHHGDDVAGRSPLSDSIGELEDYSTAVASIGAELNRSKTFTSSAWTMCEVLGFPNKSSKGGMGVFCPPSCPPPGLKAPLACDKRLGNRYRKRLERVMKTRFPWITKDARLHLPVEIGGLGYTGRGLCVGASVRRRLAAMVSRDPTVADGYKLLAKAPFKEMGLYPRPLSREVKPPEYWKAKKVVDSYDLLNPYGGETVSRRLQDVVVFESTLIEDQIRLSSTTKFKQVRASNRPTRTKAGLAFRKSAPVNIRPLTRWGGLRSIDKWISKVKALELQVPIDIAPEIRG